MSLVRLDHINIAAGDIEATKDFFVDALGLSVGARPPFQFPGYWLYAGDVAVVHLNCAAEGKAPRDTGAFSHIAFRAEGLTAVRATLSRLGHRYEERIVPRTGETQIFVDDPNGITVELTFAASET